MAVEQRQKLVLVVVAAFFALFVVQLGRIQLLGDTRPLTLAHEKSPSGHRSAVQRQEGHVAPTHEPPLPQRARRFIGKVWKKVGAA